MSLLRELSLIAVLCCGCSSSELTDTAPKEPPPSAEQVPKETSESEPAEGTPQDSSESGLAAFLADRDSLREDICPTGSEYCVRGIDDALRDLRESTPRMFVATGFGGLPSPSGIKREERQKSVRPILAEIATERFGVRLEFYDRGGCVRTRQGRLKGVHHESYNKVVVRYLNDRFGENAWVQAEQDAEAQFAAETAVAEVGAPKAAPVTSGRLTLISSPWSEVYLAGKKVGTTPFIKKKFPSGQHTLTLKSSDGRTSTLEVTVVAGQLTTKRHSL